jgi:hypothetical protein
MVKNHQHCAASRHFSSAVAGESKKNKLPRLLHFPTSTTRQQLIFWRHCRGKGRLLQGEFRTHILYFVLSFAFTLFLLTSFYQKYKKLVSFIVVSTCPLLVLLE